MKAEILEKLSWVDIMEISDAANLAYYESREHECDEVIYTDALNRLKEMAK